MINGEGLHGKIILLEITMMTLSLLAAAAFVCFIVYLALICPTITFLV